MNLLKTNPEAQRLAWQEVTWTRILLMLGVLGLIVYIILDGGPEYPSQRKQFVNTMRTAFIILTTIMLAIPGWTNARRMVKEYQTNSWDWQRLSSLSPFQLMWGRWLGFSLVWLAAVGGITVVLLLVFNKYPRYADLSAIPLAYCFGLALAAILQVAGLSDLTRSRAGLSSFSLTLLSGLCLLFFLSMSTVFQLRGYLFSTVHIFWYGIEISQRTASFMITILGLFWAAVAIWRLMRTELQYRNGLTWWMAFLGTATLYMAGFSQEVEPSNYQQGLDALKDMAKISPFLRLLLTGGVIGVVSAYVSAILEAHTPLDLRLFFRYLRERNYNEAWLRCPSWLPALVFAGICLLLAMPVNILTGGWRIEDGHVEDNLGSYMVLSVVMSALIGLRDIAILKLLEAGRTPQRGMIMWLGIMLVLHVLLPLVIPDGLHPLTTFSTEWGALSTLPAALSAILVGSFLMQKVRDTAGIPG